MKCLVLAAVVVSISAGLLALAPNPRVLLPVPIVYFIVIKLSWLELETPEVFVACVSSIMVTLAVAYLVSQCFVG